MSDEQQKGLWRIVTALAAIVVSIAGWTFQHEINGINSRLDRITDFILEHRPGIKP